MIEQKHLNLLSVVLLAMFRIFRYFEADISNSWCLLSWRCWWKDKCGGATISVTEPHIGSRFQRLIWPRRTSYFWPIFPAGKLPFYTTMLRPSDRLWKQQWIRMVSNIRACRPQISRHKDIKAVVAVVAALGAFGDLLISLLCMECVVIQPCRRRQSPVEADCAIRYGSCEVSSCQ